MHYFSAEKRTDDRTNHPKAGSVRALAPAHSPKNRYAENVLAVQFGIVVEKSGDPDLFAGANLVLEDQRPFGGMATDTLDNDVFCDFHLVRGAETHLLYGGTIKKVNTCGGVAKYAYFKFPRVCLYDSL